MVQSRGRRYQAIQVAYGVYLSVMACADRLAAVEQIERCANWEGPARGPGTGSRSAGQSFVSRVLRATINYSPDPGQGEDTHALERDKCALQELEKRGVPVCNVVSTLKRPGSGGLRAMEESWRRSSRANGSRPTGSRQTDSREYSVEDDKPQLVESDAPQDCNVLAPAEEGMPKSRFVEDFYDKMAEAKYSVSRRFLAFVEREGEVVRLIEVIGVPGGPDANMFVMKMVVSLKDFFRAVRAKARG
jgi:hypothetical protein